MLKVSCLQSFKPASLLYRVLLPAWKIPSIIVFLSLFFNLSSVPISYAQTQQFLVGMPFAGKWAYNVKVNPPYNDVNSSHPSVHKTDASDKYDWATDVYALPDTPVKVNIKNLSAGDTLHVSNIAETSCGAGMRVRVTVRNSAGKDVGWVQYEHLETSLKSNTQISNNSVLGVTKNWRAIRGKELSCYYAKNDNSVHIHVSMNNSLGNHACYVDHGNPGVVLNENDNFGVIGAANVERKKPCTSLPLINSTTKTNTGKQGTNSIPLGTSSGTTIQGSSGQKVQNTDLGKKIQGADSTKATQTETQNTKTENTGIVSRVVNFFKNVTSIFSKDKTQTTTATTPQTQPVRSAANTTPTPKKATTTAPTTTPPVETKPFDENGCPIGEPTVELTGIQILGYNTQEEFETFENDEEVGLTFESKRDILLIVTGVLNNPTSTDVEISSVGLYRESENPDFPPLLSLKVSGMELPNKTSTIKAHSAMEFKSKTRLAWRKHNGVLTKNLTPTLKYPSSATSRPESRWEWVGTPSVPAKCQPNYYE